MNTLALYSARMAAVGAAVFVGLALAQIIAGDIAATFVFAGIACFMIVLYVSLRSAHEDDQ